MVKLTSPDALPAYERFRLRLYVIAAVRHGLYPASIEEIGGSIAIWCRQNANLLGWSESQLRALAPHFAAMEEDRRRLRPADPGLSPAALAAPCAPARLSPAEKRVRLLAKLFRMTNREAALFALLARATEDTPTGQFLRAFAHDPNPEPDFEFRTADALSASGCGAAVAPGAPRVKLGEHGLMVQTYQRSYRLSHAGRRIVDTQASTIHEMGAALFGAPPGAMLPWDAFAHIPEGEIAVRMLAAASAHKEAGVNILIHGAPGHGKTAFAHALVARAGLTCGSVAETGASGGEPDRADRIAGLKLGHQINQAAGGFVLLVDEADDILFGAEAGSMRQREESRVFLHRLVEQAPTPTIWITNHARRVSDAVLRRMTLVVHVDSPPRAVRLRIAQDVFARQQVTLHDADLTRIAGAELPAALMENAARVARLSGGALQAVEMAIAGGCKVLRLPPPAPPAPGTREQEMFDPAHANADQDLIALCTQATQHGVQPVSFCLMGRPGTGKSAFARHLAERFGLEPFVRRMSDMLGPFVGETEQRIAEAFRTAEQQRRFLIVDEADSLLHTRARAQRAWEASMVNEALTWMESHPLPFAFTTNAGRDLDPASLRRFTFKITFSAMTPAQARALFEARFGAPAPAALDQLSGLTPGDFATVDRKRRFAGGDADALVGMLADELAARNEAATARIGFF